MTSFFDLDTITVQAYIDLANVDILQNFTDGAWWFSIDEKQDYAFVLLLGQPEASAEVSYSVTTYSSGNSQGELPFDLISPIIFRTSSYSWDALDAIRKATRSTGKY